MPKRKPKPRNDGLKLLELQCATIAHCAALREVADLLTAGNKDAAVARLDGAVAALHATIRGQAAGVTRACSACGHSQSVVEWVDDGRCDNCGEPLEMPGAE